MVSAGSGGRSISQNREGKFCPSFFEMDQQCEAGCARVASVGGTSRGGRQTDWASGQVGRRQAGMLARRQAGRQAISWSLTNRANVFIVAVGHEVWSERALA